MPDNVNHQRRIFLGTAAMAIAAAELGMSSATAQPSEVDKTGLTEVKQPTNTPFGASKQIDAGILNVGYAEVGPSEGTVIILLHGWPYDIHCTMLRAHHHS